MPVVLRFRCCCWSISVVTGDLTPKKISSEESRDDFSEAWDTQEYFNQFVSNYNIVTGVLLTFDSVTSGQVLWKLKDLGHMLRMLPVVTQSHLHLPSTSLTKFRRVRNTDLWTSFHALLAIPTFPSARWWGWIICYSKGTPIPYAVCSGVRERGCFNSPTKSSWKL